MKKIKVSAKTRLEIASDAFPETVQRVINALNSVSPSLHVREDSVTDSYNQWSLPLETRVKGVIPLAILEKVIKVLKPILKNTPGSFYLLTDKGGLTLYLELE